MRSTAALICHSITKRLKEIVLPVFFLQLFLSQIFLFFLIEGYPQYRTSIFYGALLTGCILLCFQRGAGILPGIISIGMMLPLPVTRVPTASTPVQVRVLGMPRYRKDSLVSLSLRVETPPYQGTYLCRAVYLPWRNSHVWNKGTVGIIQARFRVFTTTPEITSYSGRMRRRGYHGTCRIHLMNAQKGYESVVDVVRDSLRRMVRKAGAEHEGNAILLSLLLGVQDAAGRPLEMAFKKLGLSHLLVVSGFHVSFVFAVVFGLLRAIAMKSTYLLSRYAVGIGAAIASFVFTLFYVLITGITEPSLRALLALLVVLVARIRSMRGGTLHLLTFALTVIHLFWPAALCDVGVQFTVSALVGMRHASYQRQESAFYAYCRTTLYAGVYTGFIQMWWFGNLSLSGFLANPLLVPPILLLAAKGGACALVLLLLDIPGSQSVYDLLMELLDLLCRGLRFAASFEGGYLERRSTTILCTLILIPLYESARCGYCWWQQSAQSPSNLEV